MNAAHNKNGKSNCINNNAKCFNYFLEKCVALIYRFSCPQMWGVGS